MARGYKLIRHENGRDEICRARFSSIQMRSHDIVLMKRACYSLSFFLSVCLRVFVCTYKYLCIHKVAIVRAYANVSLGNLLIGPKELY